MLLGVLEQQMLLLVQLLISLLTRNVTDNLHRLPDSHYRESIGFWAVSLR